ncbi:putative diphthamide synthesis protein-domain-containing protein [Globomyces pollinis-pini]|nr:putative diphthamide synthesis protein-domain-containing protein [Globomyces pollinis-pini]
MAIDNQSKIDSCMDFVQDHRNVALQFADAQLHVAPKVAKALDSKCQTHILADTTFGPCCVDSVAAEHCLADAIIHFGDACLSTPAINCPPILYVFDDDVVDVDDLVAKFMEVYGDCNSHVLMLFDVNTCHVLDDFKARLVDHSLSKLCIWSKVLDTYPATETFTHLIQGRGFDLPSNVSLDTIEAFYVGKDSLCVSNMMMTLSTVPFILYDPKVQTIVNPRTLVNSLLNKRYVQVQRAKDANVIGIVVGTLAVASFLEIIESLKALILANGKKPYLLAVGKPSPAKLANFPEIELFVLVSCSQNALLDSREYMVPIVTPYELSLALDHSQEWSTVNYNFNLQELLPVLTKQIQKAHQHALDHADDESDEEPHFSLITGGYAVKKTYATVTAQPTEDSNTALTKRFEGQVSTFTTTSAGAEYLQNRLFQGLEVQMGQTAISEVEEGRTGIARGYTHEHPL